MTSGRAIEAVKEDLEAPRPMDRLVCGDVGFGKTEVPLRAAFAVALDGRQVLMLVPTTVLAQQHWNTFRERFADFPVRVEMVSRFRKPADVKQVLADFAAGKVEVLIGTHRVLSRDVIPKSLGLVIVDEEQRFGVAQKELLRSLRLEVDVLALTATPIPRTLHMSLAGLRDISMIETPPEGRQAIRTHVGEYDEELIRTALGRELERGGQAFYLHNRVETIEEAATKLRSSARSPLPRRPRADGERELENRMVEFLRGDADVLVSTTIIESGLDIPQANTSSSSGPTCSGWRSSTRSAVASAARRCRRTHTCSIPMRWSSCPRRGRGCRRSPITPSSAPASRSRCATSRSAAPANSRPRAVWPRGRARFRAVRRAPERGRRRAAGSRRVAARPIRIDARIDAFIPASYVDSEALKIDLHRRLALTETEDELRQLRLDVRALGRCPAGQNLFTIQEAKLKLALAGVDYLVFRGGKLSVGPLVLGSDDLRSLRSSVPTAVYSTGSHQVTLKN